MSVSGKSRRESVAKFWLGIEEATKNPISGDIEMLSQEDLMIMAMIQRAKKGNVAAFSAIMDRAYGKPKQEVNKTETHITHIPIVTFAKLPQGVSSIEALPDLINPDDEQDENIEDAIIELEKINKDA